jgi:hypothetical protein
MIKTNRQEIKDMERYKQYKYEDVGVYIKPEIDDSELHIQTKVNILTGELYDYGCELITMVESNAKGGYTKLEELIEMIEWCRVSAVIIWSYSEIEEELLDKLKEACYKNGIEINAYKEDIQSLLFE